MPLPRRLIVGFFELLGKLASWFFTIEDNHPKGRYHVVKYKVEEGEEDGRPEPGNYEVEYWDGQPVTIKHKGGDGHLIDEVIRDSRE